MSRMTLIDRGFRLYARLVEKPTAWAVGNQRILRVIFALSARLAQRMPPGCRTEDLPEHHLKITPKGTEKEGFFLYLHGGGFTIGSPRTHRALAAHIAQAAGLRALSANYPLAPEHPFPAAPEAAFATYCAMVAAGDAPVAIGGDSAGGNLALLTLQRARDAGLPMPKAMVLIGPLADLSVDVHAQFARAPSEDLIPLAWARRLRRDYVVGHDQADPAISPLLGDLTGLPPTLIQTGDGEVLRPDSEALAGRLDAAKLDLWPGLQHVWHLRAGIAPAATLACAELGAFIRSNL